LQEGGDGLAVGRLLHLHDEGHHVGQGGLPADGLAQGLGGGRPFLQEGQHGLDAPAQLADDAGGIQVVVDVLPVRMARASAMTSSNTSSTCLKRVSSWAQ
jgi:hypothetical protein